MKKIIAIAAIAMFVTLLAKAQDATVPGVYLGIKASANLTKLDAQSFSDGFKLNYALGAYLKLQLSRHFALQPEVNFSQSTSTPTSHFGDIYENIADPDYRKTVKLNYLNIPVLASFGLTDHLFLQLGPQYGILINHDENLINNGKDAFKSGDFSAVGGLWLELPVHLNISARYLVGLSNINDIDDQDKWKSQAIQLGVGFTF